MDEEIKSEALTEEELKEIRRHKRALKKKRLARKKAREAEQLRAILEGEETANVETPEERQVRLYNKAKKKMGFAPHMYRREDQADMYRQAAELFAKTKGYEESDELRKECRQKAKQYRQLYVEETYELVKQQLVKAKTLTDCRKIRENLAAIADFKDVTEQEQACTQIELRITKKIRNRNILKTFVAGVVILALVFVIIYVQKTGLLGNFL